MARNVTRPLKGTLITVLEELHEPQYKLNVTQKLTSILRSKSIAVLKFLTGSLVAVIGKDHHEKYEKRSSPRTVLAYTYTT